MFRDARIENVTAEDTLASARRAELQRLSKVGRGRCVPQRLKRPDEQRVDKFETSFEECAPGRNSAANEWSRVRGDRQHGFQRHGPRALGALPGL